MNEIILNFDYFGGKPFHALLNGHIFMSTSGYVSGMSNFLATPYLVKDENSLTLVGGKMRPSGEMQGKALPDINITLASLTAFSDKAIIPIEQHAFANADGSNSEVHKASDETESYTWTFTSPHDYDFSERLATFAVCNESEDVIASHLQGMKTLTMELHSAFMDGDFEHLAQKSFIKLQDNALQDAGRYAEIKEMYINSLETIKQQGIGYELKSADQCVFCPSCGGKLWCIGIMDSVSSAQSLQEAMNMLPAALPPSDYELFQSRLVNNTWRKMPSYLAFTDGTYSLVR